MCSRGCDGRDDKEQRYFLLASLAAQEFMGNFLQAGLAAMVLPSDTCTSGSRPSTTHQPPTRCSSREHHPAAVGAIMRLR